MQALILGNTINHFDPPFAEAGISFTTLLENDDYLNFLHGSGAGVNLVFLEALAGWREITRKLLQSRRELKIILLLKPHDSSENILEAIKIGCTDALYIPLPAKLLELLINKFAR